MNKILSILFGIITLGNVIYSFWNYSDSTAFLGFEINVWIYRLFWSLITVKLLYDGLSKTKVN